MPQPYILQNRAYLLTVIGFITTVAALGPFFLEEFGTCSMITDEHGHQGVEKEGCLALVAHETLHIAAITFGIFLIILCVIAYNSTKNVNMIFTSLAFLTFTMLSIFLLEEDLNADRIEHDEAVWVDVLLTVMIGFFGMSVFSNQKFKGRTELN